MGKETKIINWGSGYFVHHRTGSAVKRVEFASDRMSYIVLRGRWFNIILFACMCTKWGQKWWFKRQFCEEL